MITLLALALTCHVITPNYVSDWFTRDDAMAQAQGWALLGITAEVYCRPPHPDWRIRI